MHYIKLSLWIFILTLLYAMGIFDIFGFYPELLLLFSCIYSPIAKSFKERVWVMLVCGVLMSSFGGGGFVVSMLFVSYTSLLFGLIFRGKLLKHNIWMILAVMIITLVYDGFFGLLRNGFHANILYSVFFAAAVNGVFAGVLNPLIKRTFKEKERYIF